MLFCANSLDLSTKLFLGSKVFQRNHVFMIQLQGREELAVDRLEALHGNDVTLML